MERKSLKEISWQVDEPTYRVDKAYSYSTLSRFQREGVDNIEHLFDKVESPSLLFGSLVDTLLTDGLDEYNAKYLVAEFPHLPDSQLKVVKDIFAATAGVMSWKEVPDELINSIILKHKFQLNWKDTTRIKVIRENGGQYYELMRIALGKTVVDSQMDLDAKTCVNILKTSPATEWYFKNDNPFDDSIERLYQLKFKGTFKGIPVRCMADLLITDYKNKIIYPCDLKTSSKPEWRFYKSFVEWRYMMQAQLYWYIIRQNMDLDPYFKDFKLADYRFIVISNATRKPLVWEFSQTQSSMPFKLKNYEIPNWRNVLCELYYYLSREYKFPIGIEEEKPNDIVKWIEDDGI